MYDAVPQKSRSQVLSGNRLAYGGYTEFYDNTNVSASVVFSYEKSAARLMSLSTTTTGTTVSASTTTNNVKFNLDLTNFPDSSSYNTTINLSFNIEAGPITITSGSPSGSTFSVGTITGVTSVDLGNTSFSINKTFNVSGYASRNALASAVISQLTGVTYTGFTSPDNSLLSVSGSQTYYLFAGELAGSIVSATVSGGVITANLVASTLFVQSVSIQQGVPPILIA